MAVIFGASACAVEQGNITIETVELASGEYYGLRWGGTQVERFHVLARQGSPAGDVVVWSPNRDEPCSLGPLSDYAPLQPMNGGEFVLGSPSPARVAIFDQPAVEGEGSRLGFADLDCQRIPFGVEGASPRKLLRLYEPDLMDLRWVVGTADLTWMFVDPWAQRMSIVARDVTAVQPYQNGLWLIEGGRAVRRDLEGVEIASYGRGVTELLPIGRNSDLVYVDERGLVLRAGDLEMVVEEDACLPRPVPGFTARALGYYSPCAARRLVVRQADGRRFAYLENTSNVAVLDGRILFTIQGEETTALWIVYASKPMEPVLMGELPRFSLESVSITPSGFILGARQGSDNTLSLISVQTNAERDEYRFRTEHEGILELQAFDNAMAMLKADNTLSLRVGGRDLAPITGVRNRGFNFVFDGDSAALAYVSDVDENTGLGQLQLQFLSGPYFEVADEVREFHEVWWPEPGILFTTGGDDPSMNFAGVDVPCEMTSDAPWACGF